MSAPNLMPLRSTNPMIESFGNRFVPLKHHVLDEVREAALIVVFHERAGIDREPKLRALFGTLVRQDVIREPVRELAFDEARIRWDGAGGALRSSLFSSIRRGAEVIGGGRMAMRATVKQGDEEGEEGASKHGELTRC